MLPAGLLGDRFGRKKLLLGALLVFGAASLACAYASSAGELIAARAVLGLGAAFIIPLSLSVLPVLFSEEERQRAITITVGATFVAYPIGPVLGGWLLTHYWWGSVFLINGPVIALALLAVIVLLPESRSLQRRRLDLAGIVVSSLGLAGLTYGAIEAGQRGWGDGVALAAMLAGALVLAAFVGWERRVARRPAGQPLVDLTLFGSARFTCGTVLATVVTFALFGLLFAVPQYFQAVRGTDAMGAGLRLLPLIGGLMVGAAAADRLVRRIGAKATVALGFAVMAVGLGTGAAIREHALRLFHEQGYQATTVEQIAEAAEVSPSTFFRYFPSKEDVVLQDDYDPLLVAAFRAQPAELSPVAALRGAMRAVFSGMPAEQMELERERQALVVSEPELRAGALDGLGATIQLVAEVVAERVGRRPDELAVRTFAGAVLGVLLASLFAAAEDPTVDIFARIDDGLAHLEAGLPL